MPLPPTLRVFGKSFAFRNAIKKKAILMMNILSWMKRIIKKRVWRGQVKPDVTHTTCT
jgi:hypothetical protein